MRFPSSVRHVPGAPRGQVLGHNLFNGLVEWWNLDEPSSTRRGSHAALHLSDNNGVGVANGITSLAASFASASNQYLSRTSETALNIGAVDATIVLWAYVVNKTTIQAFNTKYTTSGLQRSWVIQYDSATDRFLAYVSSDGNALTTRAASTFGSPTAGVWHMLALRHVNGATIGLSVNAGAEDTTAFTGGIFSGSAPLLFGSVNAGTTWFLNGRVQRAGIWKRILTTAEFVYLYNSGRGRAYPFL